MQYFIFSGEIKSVNEGISIGNRAFRYADGLFESMFYTSGKIMYFEKHYNRLLEGMEKLRINSDKLPSIKALEEQVKELLECNEIGSAARIRLQVFRKEGGLYLPENDDCEYIIEANSTNNSEYELNKKGFIVGISKSIFVEPNAYSQIKGIAKNQMILAAMEARDNSWDDIILTNNNDFIAEASGSNVFAVINGNIYTPSISDGALKGIMRDNIIRIAKENNISINETNLSISHVKSADEVFFTNAVKGIQWVMAIGSKRYFNTMSKRILKLLNSEI